MDKTKVSIIVPVYNVEEYIEKCLESLTSQTFKKIEILVVNDGSKDKSEEIAKEFAKKDERVKVISKENGGYGSVLQLAINQIESEYFLICDPDDWLERDAIEILYNTAKEKETDITVANKYLVYIDDVQNKTIDKNHNRYKIQTNEVYSSQEKSKFAFFSVTPHAKLYKTSICKDIVFPKKVSFTDFILYIIGLEKAKSVVYIDKPLANYLIDRPGNSATDRKPKAIFDHITVFKSAYEQIKKDDLIIKYRMYVEYRVILRAYSQNSEKFLKDQYIDDIDNIRKILKGYYIDFKKNLDLTIYEKIKLMFTVKYKIGMILFLFILKLKG